MSTLPTAYGGPSLSGGRQYGIPNISAENNMTTSVHGHSNQNVGNMSYSHNNTTINFGTDEESLRIQGWLSSLELHRRHQDVRNRRLDGVGDWILRRNEFQSWRKSQDGSDNHTLRCDGGQGVGKTYISSLVIDTLREEGRGQSILVLSLYCDYQAQKDQSAVNLIGSLLRQVAVAASRIPDEIKSAFEGSKQGGGQGLRLPDMLKLFLKTIHSIERVYICVDAVDELLPLDRSELLRALRRITKDSPNTRLFLTARPHIRREIEYLTEGAYSINVVVDQEDIARYLAQKIDDDNARDPDLMTGNLKNDIMKTISDKTSEMFLLVALNIEAVLGQSSLAGRREMLRRVETTGVDLDSVYDQTLRRIREQKGDWSTLGMNVLMWVSHAERPLRVDELRHALAVKLGTADLDPENIRPQDTVLGSCLGLVVVDKESSTVRLIHYTLQEYLSRPGIMANAHKTLGETCLTYLNCRQVKKLPTAGVPDPRDMPFLEYSSFYWGNHAKLELADCGKYLALELLGRYNNHISSTLLFKPIHDFDFRPLTHYLFHGLHCASYFGIDEIVAALIEMEGCDINQGDCMGFMPLTWAARQGNLGAVRLLLTRHDVDLDRPDNEGQTPLSWASINGHEAVVRLLLSQSMVNPDKPGNSGQTPLSRASFRGHEGVVRLLLARDEVNPDKPDNNGKTPLWRASFSGHEGVVRLLLARDEVNPDKPSNDGPTPLWWASFCGHEGVVRLLLARGEVNPDKPDNYGKTPLWGASFRGHEGVVRLLLARDEVNPDKPDNYGKTPLWGASIRGHEGVVRLLLARGEVNPDKPDNDGKTPLWWASFSGHEGVVRLLLARGEVNPDKPDNDGKTPLWGASFRGHEGVVRLLLARGEVNPDKSDNDGKTRVYATDDRCPL